MKVLIKSFIFLSFLCTPLLLIDQAWANPEEKEQSAFEKYEKKFAEQKKKEKTEESYRFKGFTSYRPQFAQICSQIDDDGHLEWLIAQGEKFSSLTDCVPCRTLYLLIKSTCKIKKPVLTVKKVKKKTEEPSEEAEAEGEVAAEATKAPEKKKIIRLDPSTELIDYVSIVFRTMATKPPIKDAKASYQGIAHLISEMRNPEGKTTAAKSYYETLAAYIEAPFIGQGLVKKDEISVKTDEKLPISNPSTSIDELF